MLVQVLQGTGHCGRQRVGGLRALASQLAAYGTAGDAVPGGLGEHRRGTAAPRRGRDIVARVVRAACGVAVCQQHLQHARWRRAATVVSAAEHARDSQLPGGRFNAAAAASRATARPPCFGHVRCSRFQDDADA